MKSYDQTLNEIYNKANKQITEMQQRKQKRRKVFAAVVPVCFLLVVSLSIGVGMGLGKTPTADSPVADTLHDNLFYNAESENTITDQNSVVNNSENDVIISDGVNNMEPSIFPSAWKKMNAVIVKWGEQNDQTWVENYGKYSHYNEENYSIECVGVNVEFVTIFSETMSESLINDIEKVIEQTTYLMIPKLYLEEIEVGDTSLVFLQKIAHIADTDAAGKFLGTYTTVLGAMVGDCLAEDKYVPAPIFNIENNKICVPEQAYETRPENGEYYSYIMGLLQEANEYVQKNDSSTSVAFEDGASVEDIAELFAFICSSKSR